MTSIVSILTVKHCNGCASVKPVEGFWKGQSLCIDCAKGRQKNRWESRTPKKRLEQHLKYKYSLTIKELNEALEKQNGGCAICEEVLPDLLVYNNRKRGYAIDHNHETGKFRGVLCLKCNTMLGMARENHDILAKASAYLEQQGSYQNLIDNVAAGRAKGK
jgi:hypothetical protein